MAIEKIHGETFSDNAIRLSKGEIRALFDDLDIDKNGTISYEELLTAGIKRKKLGPFFTDESCKAFFDAVAVNSDGEIDFEEFREWVQLREGYLLKFFHTLDLEANGRVSTAQLQISLTEFMGVEVSATEAQQILDAIDEDKNGTIEYKELLGATLFLTADMKDLVKSLVDDSSKFFLYSDQPLSKEVPKLRTFTAGIIAGIICRTLTAPLDRISAVMRAGGTIHGSSSIFGIGRSMIKVGGFTSLWRGNGMNCMKDGPESGLMFMAYDALKCHVMQDTQKPTVLEKFVTGGAAGTFSLTLTYPGYVLQTRIAIAEKSEYQGIADCALKTVRKEGISALFKGYDAAILRVIPECGFNLMGYMTLREHFVPSDAVPTVFQSLMFGSCSSLVSQTIAAPMLTVRTRLMAQGSLDRPVVYNNAFDCLYKIVHGNKQLNLPAEGVRALFRGHAAYLMKMIPGTAIQFAAFETISRYIKPFTG